MYESEVNSQRQAPNEIPANILECFREAREGIPYRTVLPWSEHCTECAWPSCYSTCEFYRDRSDGKCRRFQNGMVRVECRDALNSYILKITFMRWAMLWTPGNIRLRSINSALRMEKRDYFIGSGLQRMPLPNAARKFATNKRYSLKTKLAYAAEPADQLPSSFLLECYNPGAAAVNLSFIVRPGDKGVGISFQQLVVLAPGFQRVRIPYKDIAALVDLKKPFRIEMTPNHYNENVTLFFGLMDFVWEAPKSISSTGASAEGVNPKVKCIVWDLDNTIWDGILVEDGLQRLALKPQIKDMLEELDRRGILLSVASKNNYDDARAALKQMGLDELFLAAQISWQPKSSAIQAIAQQLNIGLDAILFVDDSIFEREEVAATLPTVRTMDALYYTGIVNLEECQVPVTAESRERRQMYRMEAERKDQASRFIGDYAAFLRDCDIRMNIFSLEEGNLERVHELTQRTNQMNFSGNRYNRNVLREIMKNPSLDTYVLEVEDRFGSYGIVGFSIVEKDMPVMTDLMFSCRIQSKRVEHAFLAWAIRKYTHATGKNMWANYRKSERNAQSGKVFEDLGMHEAEIVDGVSRLVYSCDRSIPDDGIVRINAQVPSIAN